jgi:hypothetical protein
MISADSPWKEVCERKLALVFALLYPDAHAAVDWSKDDEALDQELRRLSPDSAAPGRVADRLLRAAAAGTGDPRYFHLEVQGKKVRGFRRRIHECNLRAEERFGAHVVSLVVLTDRNPTWRPRRYVAGLFPVPPKPEEAPQAAEAAAGPDAPEKKKRRRRYLDERTLRFLTVKLLDYVGREAELEALENPMGVFVVAHLEALRTRRDPAARQDAKLRLIRNLRQRKMDAEDARLWLTCLDWFLQLPKERERAVSRELERLDKEEGMPYLSFIERQALERGLEKGEEKGLGKALGWYLETKYGAEGLAWLAAAGDLGGEARLKDLCERIFLADTPEKVRALLVPPPGGAAPQA